LANGIFAVLEVGFISPVAFDEKTLKEVGKTTNIHLMRPRGNPEIVTALK
jgi:hypothetical protein